MGRGEVTLLSMENMVSDSIEGQFKIKVEPVTRDDLIRSYWINFLTKFYQILADHYQITDVMVV